MNPKNRFTLKASSRFALLAFVLALAACGGGGSNNEPSPSPSPSPAPAPSPSTPNALSPKVVRISAAENGYVLAVRSDGNVLAWGGGMAGGTGTLLPGTTARQISGVSNIAGVEAHTERALVVGNNGTLYGWGRNAEGALGVATPEYNLTIQDAVAVNQVSGVVQALSCDYGGYALRNDGTVWLVPGERSNTGQIFATQVAGLSGINHLVVTERNTFASCDLLALDNTGRAWQVTARKFDYNAATQRTPWVTTVQQNLVTPPNTKLLACDRVFVDGGEGTGSGHCLAQTTDGKLWSWGENNAGQLGLGDTVNRTIATLVGTGVDVKKLIVGRIHSYLLIEDGTVYGWGSNNLLAGRTGQSDSAYSDFWRPGVLPNISGVADLVMGGIFSDYVVALKKDGTIWSWGYNRNGVFADGTSDNYSILPVQAKGIFLN